ncbi:phage holin family protein [Bacteroidales bacterium OttesenSCG-928-C19]|nr:phage holin family protein [Bacteroidales bacterium OttesenSCG-928-C19]
MKIKFSYNSGNKVNFFAKIVVLTLAILLASWLLPDEVVAVDSIWVAVLASVIVALLNTFLRPILIVLTLPFTFFTMGIFLLFINAFIVSLTASIINWAVDGDVIVIGGFWSALLFSVLITIMNTLLEIPAKLLNNKVDENDPNNYQNLSENSDDHFDDYDDITEDEK